ncbi:MAG: cupin domain-containing protein [Actinomycetota bacterium]
MAEGIRLDQHTEIRDAIQGSRERPLADWVAVAIWDHVGGDVTVLGEATPLQMKGYLHSGIWALAHNSIALDGPPIQQLDDTTDIRRFPGGRMDVVRMGGSVVGRGTFEPGFKWSESIGPIVGMTSCALPHAGYVISGSMRIAMDDGTEFTLEAGEAIQIAPGHDAWTIGEEPCVVLEVLSAERYGKKL